VQSRIAELLSAPQLQHAQMPLRAGETHLPRQPARRLRVPKKHAHALPVRDDERPKTGGASSLCRESPRDGVQGLDRNQRTAQRIRRGLQGLEKANWVDDSRNRLKIASLGKANDVIFFKIVARPPHLLAHVPAGGHVRLQRASPRHAGNGRPTVALLDHR
jgi:hypothetical protein